MVLTGTTSHSLTLLPIRLLEKVGTTYILLVGSCFFSFNPRRTLDSVSWEFGCPLLMSRIGDSYHLSFTLLLFALPHRIYLESSLSISAFIKFSAQLHGSFGLFNNERGQSSASDPFVLSPCLS